MFELEYEAYKRFRTMYSYNAFPHQRYGQAFYNHFSLHKMNKSPELAQALDRIYETRNAQDADTLIRQLFDIK